MDLDQMRGFLETARQGSFTRAAEKLYLTQPAVSLQIKALEEDLGELLLERSGKQVLITEAGRLFLARVEEILSLVDLAREEVASLSGLRTGHLKIGSGDTNLAYVLPPVVKAYRKAYPGIAVRLTDRPSPQVVRMVSEGALDFGLVTLPAAGSRIEVEALFEREDVVVVDPEHPLRNSTPVTLTDVCAYPLLMLVRDSTSRSLLDQAFRDAGLRPEIAMELGSIEVIKRYVEIGVGIALVPEVAAREEISTGRLVGRPVDGLPKRTVGLVWRRGGYWSRAAVAFAECLKTHIVCDMGWSSKVEV